MAKTIDEFNEEARAFVAKAKAAGKSNTGIMNTIKMKYMMFESEKQNEITPYDQARLDLAKKGTWQIVRDASGNPVEMFNSLTGERKPYDASAETSPAKELLQRGPENQQETTNIGDQITQSPDVLTSTTDLKPDLSYLQNLDPNKPNISKAGTMEISGVPVATPMDVRGDVQLQGDIPLNVAKQPYQQPQMGVNQAPVGFMQGLYQSQPSPLQNLNR